MEGSTEQKMVSGNIWGWKWTWISLGIIIAGWLLLIFVGPNYPEIEEEGAVSDTTIVVE